MTQDQEIQFLQSQVKTYTLLCELQVEVARLKQRVSELEHDQELEQITGGQGAFSR